MSSSSPSIIVPTNIANLAATDQNMGTPTMRMLDLPELLEMIFLELDTVDIFVARYISKHINSVVLNSKPLRAKMMLTKGHSGGKTASKAVPLNPLLSCGLQAFGHGYFELTEMQIQKHQRRRARTRHQPDNASTNGLMFSVSDVRSPSPYTPRNDTVRGFQNSPYKHLQLKVRSTSLAQTREYADIIGKPLSSTRDDPRRFDGLWLETQLCNPPLPVQILMAL